MGDHVGPGWPPWMLLCQHGFGNKAQPFPALACAKRLGREGEDLPDQIAAELQKKKEAGTVKRIPGAFEQQFGDPQQPWA